MARTSRKSAGATHRKPSASRQKARSGGARTARAERHTPARAPSVPHVPEPAPDSAQVVENHDLIRPLGAGMAVDALLKLLGRTGGVLRLASERRVRRPHPEGLDDYTERKYGGKQRGLHLVIRDWEAHYRGHTRNGTNVDIRGWGFMDDGVVRYWEREQWAIGEAPFRRAGVTIEGGSKRLAEAVLKAFGQEGPAPK